MKLPSTAELKKLLQRLEALGARRRWPDRDFRRTGDPFLTGEAIPTPAALLDDLADLVASLLPAASKVEAKGMGRPQVYLDLAKHAARLVEGGASFDEVMATAERLYSPRLDRKQLAAMRRKTREILTDHGVPAAARPKTVQELERLDRLHAETRSEILTTRTGDCTRQAGSSRRRLRRQGDRSAAVLARAKKSQSFSLG